MSAYLTEEEQIEALKRWWKDNGKTIVAATAVSLAIFFGWNQYKDHQVTKAAEGSVIFQKFVALTTEIGQEKTSAEQEAQIQTLTEELNAHSNNDLYANYAQLYLAKLAVEKGDLDSAMTILGKITDESLDLSVKDLARLRHARLLAASGKNEEALTKLSANVSASYASAYSETKGDILLGAKRIQDAHAAYQTALLSTTPDQVMRLQLIKLKLENTAVAAKVDSPSSVVPETVSPHTSKEEGEA